MKISTISTAQTENKIMRPGHDLQLQLSENALYAIALITVLKEMIFPATLKDHLKALKSELAN
jgi:hypothetical protein